MTSQFWAKWRVMCQAGICPENVNSYTSVSPGTQVQLLINQPFRQQLTKQLVD